MSDQNIFISVGKPSTDKQEEFIKSIEKRLEDENFIPKTVGRNIYKSDPPLKTIMELMDDCSGAIIIGIERTYLATGLDKRGGTHQKNIQDIKYVTPWNQIEAAIAYCKGKPLLLILEEELQGEGLLGIGFDWYVMWVNPDSFLTSSEFIQVFADWKKKVEEYLQKKSISKSEINTAELTIGQLVTGLKGAQLWGLLAGLIAILIGAFVLGTKLAPLFK